MAPTQADFTAVITIITDLIATLGTLVTSVIGFFGSAISGVLSNSTIAVFLIGLPLVGLALKFGGRLVSGVARKIKM